MTAVARAAAPQRAVIASEAKQSMVFQGRKLDYSSRSLSSGAHSRDPLAPCNDSRSCISVVRNDGVVATKPKSPVTFHVNGIARFTFFRREDGFDRSNKFIAG
jgi:hypothetical protein